METDHGGRLRFVENRVLARTGLCPLAGAALAQDGAGGERLGAVHFATACAPAVQPRFDRAVALLHSFHLDAAVGAFTEVAAADPSCGMAHWGVAMAWLGNPLAAPPSARGLQDGGAAVARARAVGDKTAREHDYIDAVEIFYKDAAILEQIFAEEPHPGVAHDLIHSYDFPPIAAKGLPAARRYASIAPSGPHALHMPSHRSLRGAPSRAPRSRRASRWNGASGPRRRP
jgi:hypothetical protein